VSESGVDYLQLLDEVGGLPVHSSLRFNVVGDLVHHDGEISYYHLSMLDQVVRRKKLRVLMYTHHLLNWHNLQISFEVSFVINFSFERVGDAVSALDRGVNAVVVLPSDTVEKYLRVGDVHIVVCPEQYREVTCAECMLCSQDRVSRRIIVGFKAHGTQLKRVNKLIG
jgi:choline kinase